MSRSKFQNTVPIDDPITVLDLLWKRWGDQTQRHIDRWLSDGPYVEIAHHHDRSDSEYDRFRVTDRVVDELLGLRLVTGKPKWGYTEMRELSISEAGAVAVQEARTRLGLDDLSTAAE